MKISNVRVYGLEESIIASSYPMSTCTYEIENSYDCETEEFKAYISNYDKKRAKHLGNAIPGSGHDCYLKGIIVQCDIQAPEYWWRQFDRYHFADYVSSMSKMHRILQMDLKENCNKYVDIRILEILREKISIYHKLNSEMAILNEAEKLKLKIELKEQFQEIISNVPCGLELTARITTNYLQLKSMYNQRKNHKLEEWREVFCKWMINELPLFEELTGL